ncbi:hypothetical protein ABB22_15625 [Stenotrophomonas nitritireducens]|uniref:Uncharacterized protein n=2 Tax=Stenotrophomonas nitritireducens TaxID=83617 RepID=A0ABR5NGN1_9GAMM|nr:hypothetical protein ABB22_15625 [Stenotrophomonas nitritireducens]
MTALRPNYSLKSLLSVLQLLLELALVVFFIVYGLLHWSSISTAFVQLSPLWLLTCGLLYSAMHFFAVLATASLLRSLGCPRPYGMLFVIHIRRLPAKYLPGGIWHAVGRGADLVKDGIPIRRIGQLVGIEQLLAIWWSGFLGFVFAGLAFNGRIGRVASMIAMCWLIISLLALVWVRVRPGWRYLVEAVSAPEIVLAYVAGWICLAAGFTLYIWHGVDMLSSPLQVAASYLVSWMIGAIAFFAPQGIGVFEISMARALGQSGSLQADIIWFIGSYRLLVLTADLAIWGGGCAWFRVIRVR